MKRIGNIRDKICSVGNGVRAVISGTLKKRGKREVAKLLYDKQEVEKHPELWHLIDPKKAEEYAISLCDRLLQRTWKHHAPRHKRQFCPSSSGGKWRDLYIPTLEDHIVHHMVMQACMPAFMRGMHPHCCGSVPGRGIKHITHWVWYWMQHDLECRYFVKLDIRKFLSEYRQRHPVFNY